MSGSFRRLLPLDCPQVAGTGGADGVAGAKAARLAAALRAGFPVLPGWVVPAAEARPALSAGAAAVSGGRPAAGRRMALGHRLDPELAGELSEAARRLGGRVIIRSSSPLEADPRWSGAFSSVAEVGPEDAGTAVRSCWASAFAVDPLERLESSGLPLSALEVGLVIQPEIRPTAGGVARVLPGGPTQASGTAAAEPEVIVEGVRGHPGALLSGWADGASARLVGGAPAAGQEADAASLADLVGADTAAAVARLAAAVHRELGEDVIEWAAVDGEVHLLQALRSAGAGHGAGPPPARDEGPEAALVAAAGRPPAQALAGRQWMPLLAAFVQAEGERVAARPAAPGTAAGRLVAVRPHERPSGHCRDAILLVDRPAPALAPLLFGARGVIARTGAPGSHLAEVARSLGVPMVVGCRLELAVGPGDLAEGWQPAGGAPVGAAAPADGRWLAAIDGDTGDVAVLPAGPG